MPTILSDEDVFGAPLPPVRKGRQEGRGTDVALILREEYGATHNRLKAAKSPDERGRLQRDISALEAEMTRQGVTFQAPQAASTPPAAPPASGGIFLSDAEVFGNVMTDEGMTKGAMRKDRLGRVAGDLGRNALGLVDAAASLFSGTPAQIAGGIAGTSTFLAENAKQRLGLSPRDGGERALREGNRVLEAVQESNFGFGQYKPLTERGKETSEAISSALERPVEAAGNLGERIAGNEGRLAGELWTRSAMELIDPLVVGGAVAKGIGKRKKEQPPAGGRYNREAPPDAEAAAPDTIELPSGRVIRLTPKQPRPPHAPGTADRILEPFIQRETVEGYEPPALKELKARRRQAKDAFARDPAYADQLRNFAEEEARVRAQTAPIDLPPFARPHGGIDLPAPGGRPQTGPRTPRTGSRGAFEPPGLPPTRPRAVETGAPPALDSALTKIRAGRGFDLTAEERIATQAIRSKFGKPALLDEHGRPLKQGGASTLEMNALIAALGLGTALALQGYFDSEDAMTTLGGAAAAGAIGARSALGPLLKGGGYTLKTLERLPQNRTEFSRDQVLQQLARQDVSKAERDLVMRVMGEKETISANELVEGFRQEGKALELRPEETEEWADYGLGEIGRQANPYTREPAPFARTTLYQNPLLSDTSNHFGDPEYFAHTRSFDENGVRHVVEIQSDVAQKAKEISEGERKEAEAAVERFEELVRVADDVERVLRDKAATASDYLKALNAYEALIPPDILLDVKLRLGDRIWDRLGLVNDTDNFLDAVGRSAGRRAEYDTVYDQTKEFLARVGSRTGRLPFKEEFLTDREKYQRENGMVRGGMAEETARWRDQQERAKAAGAIYVEQAADALEDAFYYESRRATLHQAEARTKLASSVPPAIQPLLKTWYKRIIREELARAPGEPVRFATADTVAKVEGWPNRQENFDRSWGTRPPPGVQRPSDAERFSPEHQSIYDRYRGEIEKFLRSEFSAKPHTDLEGHTWLEVPAASNPSGPKKMLGKADLRTMATLAAASGAALAADFLSDDPHLGVDLAAALLAGAATRAKPATLAKAGAVAALVAYFSSDDNRARNAAFAAAVVGLGSYAASRNSVIARWAKDSLTAAEIVAGNLSAELRTMSPPLLRRFTKHERDLKVREHNAVKRISAAAEGLIRLPNTVRKAIDTALFIGDRARALAIVDGLRNAKLSAGLRDAFAYIDETGAELGSLNLMKRHEKGYFPRVVTDLDGLLDYLGKQGETGLKRKLEEATRAHLKATGSVLSDIEMSRVVNDYLQAAVRQKDTGGQSGFLKKRSIHEITQDLLPFYATAGDSLALYARSSSREIERAKFFGRDLRQHAETKGVNVEESVGALVLQEEKAGKMTSHQLRRLKDMLNARFGPGEHSPNFLVQAYKNTVYALLLGNIQSALVQVGEIAISAAVHGLVPTIRATANVLGAKAKWHLDDFGLINHLSEDLIIGARGPLRLGNHQLSTAKFLDWSLKWGSFSLADEFSKSVTLNAAAKKFEKLAKTPKGVLELQRLYGDYFGSDMPQLISDLREGKRAPLVGELLFRELSDTQVTSKLETPQGYLASPNGRALYTFKTFLDKQLNLVRERGFREIAKGDAASVRRGTAFLLRYSLALGLAGATIGQIQAWISGEDTEFSLSDIPENVFKAFGWGQYAVDRVRQGKGAEAAAAFLLPPHKLFDEIVDLPEELSKWYEGDEKADPRGMMYLPLVGKLIYKRFLGGAEKANAREERRRAREENAE